MPVPPASAEVTADLPAEPEAIEVRGILLEADARSRKEGQIEIVSSGGSRQKVHVPRGLMSDVVKPYFEEKVVVQARLQDGRLMLESIDPAEEDEAG